MKFILQSNLMSVSWRMVSICITGLDMMLANMNTFGRNWESWEGFWYAQGKPLPWRPFKSTSNLQISCMLCKQWNKWQVITVKPIHTSAQVLLSNWDTAWQRFHCLLKAMQMSRTSTVQQKMLVHFAEYMKPDGMNWYQLHHWEHYRNLSGMSLCCFHSQKMSRLSILI